MAVLCPPAWGPVIAGMLGGIAAGATSAAVNGAGLEGILQAAALGGAMGAIGGGIYLNYGTDSIPYMIGGGAALATARAGLEGLSHFAAGFAGGVTGSVMANDWLANTSNNEAGSAACVEDDPLKWNGRELSATDAKGNEIGSWGGVSGRTGSTTSQAHQRIRGYGPIPEGGQYSVNPQSIQRWSDLSWYQKALAAVGRGEWRGGVQTWGNTRVPINIQGGTVLSRGDFFIHGGAYPGVGTGGCIKLQNPGSFFRYLSGQNGSIPLTVKY
ncbi:MAG: hypothetical protein A4E72_00097 [Syntrophus sp. PtaU1.Bin208]|nr:MAG: hypothetical protein A4E72_00097 [Syntrophus sp. PtaU1.Bin208]